MLLKVIQGTLKSGRSLCMSCSAATYIRGNSIGEQIQICNATYPSRSIEFVVAECSEYNAESGPSLKNMEKIAWEIQVKGGRYVGFNPPSAKSTEKDKYGDPIEDSE